MVTTETPVVKMVAAFPKGWVRKYPVAMELVPTDALAQESGAWDRWRAGSTMFANGPDGQWVERLGGLPYAEVELGYLSYVAGLGYAESRNIRAWLASAAGLEHTRAAAYRRKSAQYAANAAEREGESGSGDRFILGDSESGFIPTLDDKADDGYYAGARWLRAKTEPDFDPSPWTVCGMAVRSIGDLKFKGSNLLPVEGRGDADRDWEPAPWQAYAFLKYMRASGNTGWLTKRKSAKDEVTAFGRMSWKAAVEVTVGRTELVPTKTKVVRRVNTTVTDLTAAAVLRVAHWHGVTEHAVRVERMGGGAGCQVRVGYEVAPAFKPKSVDGTVELPGEWLPGGPDGDGKMTFVNRHKWDAVTTGYVALRSLYQALTERGLGAFAEAADPRQAVCQYAADVWASLPTEKECDGDLAKWRAWAGKLADAVVTKAAELADEAEKTRARDELAAIAAETGAFREAVEARLVAYFAARRPERDGDDAVTRFHAEEADRRKALKVRLRAKAFLAYERATRNRPKFQVRVRMTQDYAICHASVE